MVGFVAIQFQANPVNYSSSESDREKLAAEGILSFTNQVPGSTFFFFLPVPFLSPSFLKALCHCVRELDEYLNKLQTKMNANLFLGLLTPMWLLKQIH